MLPMLQQILNQAQQVVLQELCPHDPNEGPQVFAMIPGYMATLKDVDLSFSPIPTIAHPTPLMRSMAVWGP